MHSSFDSIEEFYKAPIDPPLVAFLVLQPLYTLGGSHGKFYNAEQTIDVMLGSSVYSK